MLVSHKAAAANGILADNLALRDGRAPGIDLVAGQHVTCAHDDVSPKNLGLPAERRPRVFGESTQTELGAYAWLLPNAPPRCDVCWHHFTPGATFCEWCGSIACPGRPDEVRDAAKQKRLEQAGLYEQLANKTADVSE